MKTENEQKSLVSVIIPAYNAEKFIERTLTSVIKQTYSNLEILVIDDGSQDGTEAIVRDFMQRDERVHFWQQENAGVAAARNLGIEKANGEFIAPIDADDLWYPENIEKQVECLVSGGKNVGLVYSWSVDIDENDVPTGSFRAATIEGEVYTTLVCHNFLGNASCSMMRRRVVQEMGGYNSELKRQNAQGCEDWELYLKIAQTYQIKAVRDFLVGYRKLPESMSRNYETMARSHQLIITDVRQNHPEVAAFFCRLSSSNLYMYFAHQSYFTNNYKTTLYWLKQAIIAEFITPFIRPGLYRLFLFSWLKKRQEGKPITVIDKQSSSNLTLNNIYDQKLKLNLMLSIGNAFHQGVTLFSAIKKYRTLMG